MVSSFCSTSGRGRVTLVMATVPALLVPEVVLFLLWKVIPAQNNASSVTSRVGITYHHKINTTSFTSRAGTTYHQRVTRPLPLVEQRQRTRYSCDCK
jgi:hypothetical protein